MLTAKVPFAEKRFHFAWPVNEFYAVAYLAAKLQLVRFVCAGAVYGYIKLLRAGRSDCRYLRRHEIWSVKTYQKNWRTRRVFANFSNHI